MIVAKRVADFITSMRVLIAVCLVWLGFSEGASGLTKAVWLMIADWAGDVVDGRIARRSRIQYHTWIGDHDLEVDMIVSVGLLVYMLLARLVNVWWVIGYVILWALYFWKQGGIPHSLGMLFQAPIYGWFIWISLQNNPRPGMAIIIFVACVLIITWPYFPRVVVPGFLKGLSEEKGK